MSNYSVMDFFRAKIVFPENVRKDVAKYLLILLVCAGGLSAYLLYSGIFNVLSVLSFYTMGVILMPFCLYIGYSVKRVVRNVGKSEAEKEKVTYWLFSKMVFNLMVIISTYFYLAMFLLIAILLLMTKGA